MAVVSLTMRDERGVVHRLVSAIADLDVNVEVLESSSINQLNQHVVTLLVDLALLASDDENYRSSDSVQARYRSYQSQIPVQDYRCVQIFESVVLHCADVLVSRRLGGEVVPDITIQPIARRSYWTRVPVDIRSANEGSPAPDEGSPAPGTRLANVEISLPDLIASQLRGVLEVGPQDNLSYLYISDADERNLRVFFFLPRMAGKLIHLGFEHLDIPGALAELLAATAAAQFNILTSLLRKRGNQKSVWEAVLEYQPDADQPEHVPPRPPDDEELGTWYRHDLLPWVKQKIDGAAADSGALARFRVNAQPPGHPKYRGPDPLPTMSLGESPSDE